MTHSPYEAPEMIPEADFAKAREQLRERRRIFAAVFIVLALVCALLVGALHLNESEVQTRHADTRALDQLIGDGR